MRKIAKKSTFHLPDIRYHLFFLPLVLTTIGLYFIFEASSVEALDKFNDSFYFLKKQAISLIIAFVMLLVARFTPLDFLKKQAFNLMLIALVLLILVLIPGIGIKIAGARRWINLPFFNIQPVEVAKFAAIVYCSAWFSFKEAKRFASFVILSAMMFGLVMLQPDMGSASILAIILIAMYSLSGNDLRPLLQWSIPVLALIYFLITSSPYRMERLQTLLDPTRDPLGDGYHINQIFIALQNGGTWGEGLGLSRQKYAFLPEAHTDSIFAIIAENIGFFGASIIIGLFIMYLYSIYILYLKVSNPFAKLLVSGIFIYFSLQLIINLSAITGLVPLTGVPLPFFSYGGTHLLVSYICVGILLHISRNFAKR